ncbi:MAG: PEP/pyruvate-binding domain-containing protein, partial [Pirellulaceae bacterium]|nr:PEP/pyruvate-binding domain-containing protein [Pirellulaceae bacterium]
MNQFLISSSEFQNKSAESGAHGHATRSSPLAAVQALESHDWGGKTINLLRLAAAGFAVPPLVAISAQVFRQLVDRHPEIRRLLQELDGPRSANLEAVAQQLREAFRAAEFPPELRDELSERLRVSQLSEASVAVRSSASDEDGADFSFAGMHDSFLFVQGFEQILVAAKNVWASAFQSRALAYRLENKIPLDRLGVSVIVQQMIQAQTSGVVFTINPANNRTDQLLVSSVWGAGEGLVSGALPADTFVVDKSSGEVQAEVVEKTHRVELDREKKHGSRTVVVPVPQQTAPTLSNEQIQEVASVSQQIERHYRRPQDIEFCFDGSGKLFVVQTRPVTRV